MADAERLEELERRVDGLSRRLRAVEAAAGVAPAASVAPPRPATPAPGPRPAAPAGVAPAPTRPPAVAPKRSVEDLVGGRVLAWAGGAAVLMGLVLLAAVAVTHGWLGEGARTAGAGLLSAALLGAGAWLHERRGRTDAARAAAGAGLAGLFVTAVLGARVYAVVPLAAGVALAAIAGIVAVALALRWQTRGLAALGILSALAAPAAVGAGGAGTLVLLWIMAAAAATVLLARRWDWLALAAYGVVTPQWLAWLALDEQGVVATLAALLAFGALATASAVGFELRTRARRLRPAGAFLVALNALVLAAAGWLALDHAGGERVADGWLVLLALGHLVAAVLAGRSPRVSSELATLLAVLAAVLGDVAAAALVHGPALPAVWVAGATVAAALARRARNEERDAGVLRRAPWSRRAADLGVGAHVALAAGHALTVDAPLSLATAGGLTRVPAVVLLVVAAGCLAAGRLAGWERGPARLALDAAGLAAVTYLLACRFDGAALAAAWAAEAVALGAIASRTREASASLGALALLSLAGAHAVLLEAPPAALAGGLAAPLAALAALGLVATAALALGRQTSALDPAARQLRLDVRHLRTATLAAGALAALHLASAELVTAVHGERGQMLLSALWALAGTAAVLAGLRLDTRPVRLAGLGLLLVTAAKVFAVDLAALDSGWRVGSFLVLGLLLLAGSFAWQRLRPPAPRRA